MTKAKQNISAISRERGDSNVQEGTGQGKGTKALKQSKLQPPSTYSILKFCVTSTGDPATIEHYSNQQTSGDPTQPNSGSRGKAAKKMTNTNSMPTNSLACMLKWLETGTNKATVYGRQTTVVGPKLESKQAALERLAKELNMACNLDPPISWDGARKRLDKYKEAYACVFNWSNSTGAGVTEGGNAVNFDDELESRCFGFKRMHALFMHCPKVKPTFEIKSNLGGVVCTSRKTNYSIAKLAAVGDEEGGKTAKKIVEVSDDEEGQDVVYDQEIENDPGFHGDDHEEGLAFRNYRESSPVSTISTNINSNSKRKHSNERDTTSSKGGSVRTQSPKGMREDRRRAEAKDNDDIGKIMEKAEEARRAVDAKLMQKQEQMELERQVREDRRQEVMLEEAEKARVHEVAQSRADHVMKLVLQNMSVEKAEEIVDRVMRNAAVAASQTLGNTTKSLK
ncbi:MAG: hypothetical protein J3R72DRAFT_472476 [Linnemannia gamsii]|nr:MAG: hypothetical protein J3R72DRAFT_472476 [Linnemannia gamsii]